MSKLSIYGAKLKGARAASGLSAAVESIEVAIDDIKRGGNTLAIGRASYAVESIDANVAGQMETAAVKLQTAIESMATRLGYELTEAQKSAGVAAGLMVQDPQGFLASPVSTPVAATESMAVIDTIGMSDALTKRGIESYDEKENRQLAQYTVAYNVQASRQDEFGEAFFPTVTITPDNLGYIVQARLVSVFNDFQRNVSGALDNYNKKNIIRAAIDYRILKNDMTRIRPVYQAASAANFVDQAVIPATAITIEDETVTTAPLAVNKRFSLLGLSQTATLLANGVMDPSDSIDPGIYLDNIYVKFGSDILKFSVRQLPLASFAAAVQGNYREMKLNFTSESLLVNTNTAPTVDSSALVTLAPVTTANANLRLRVQVSGSINVETGETTVYAGAVEVASVIDSSGAALDLTAAPWAALVTAAGSASVIGYDLYAFRTNSNRRQRGQLLDVTFYNQLYPVPLRSPITVLRPVNSDGQSDASDLSALITATQIRASNEAVTALLEAAQALGQYVSTPVTAETLGVTPDILGIGRLLVVPAYIQATVDMNKAVASLNSSDRAADIAATLVNVIRDMAYRLYRDSGYQPAANALAGGNAAAPTVIIGTDPVLARYLMVEGDLRTLGSELNCKLVSTNDLRMAGRIAVTFGQFDNGSANTPNPLHFGNMAWKPEMTLVLPIARGGQISKELTVSPSFRHIVNLPVLGLLTVTNVPNVVAAQVPFVTAAQSIPNNGYVVTLGNEIN
jgi:hypothetical protein